MHLYRYGDTSSFLNLTGITKRCFQDLLHILFPQHDQVLLAVKKRGRPSNVCPATKLGVLLIFMSSMMAQKYLCLIFGLTPSAISRLIVEMLVLVINKLQSHPDALVKWPS
jgi:hypothetical protein